MKTRFKELNQMIADMEHAPEKYRPTHFWDGGTSEIVRDFEVHGLESFRSYLSTTQYFVPLYGIPAFVRDASTLEDSIQNLFPQGKMHPRFAEQARQMLSGVDHAFNDYRVFLASDKEQLPYLQAASESSVGKPVQQFEFDQKKYSRSMLNYLLGFCFLKQHVNMENIDSVLEIGGGFGSVGEILNSDSRNKSLYIDVDLPVTGFAASSYLRSVLGSDAVAGYAETRERNPLSIDEMKNEYKAVVLCPWQIEFLQGNVDLFINFISFQEMEPPVVANYLQQVDRLQTRYILLRNLKEGKQVATEDSIGVKVPIIGEDYDKFLPNYTLLGTNTVPFGYLTTDGFHSELRLYQRAKL